MSLAGPWVGRDGAGGDMHAIAHTLVRGSMSRPLPIGAHAKERESFS